MAYYDQPQFGLTMDQLTLKTCELKPRLHNSIIISSSGLCLATVTVPSNLLQRLSKDFTGCAPLSSAEAYMKFLVRERERARSDGKSPTSFQSSHHTVRAHFYSGNFM